MRWNRLGVWLAVGALAAACNAQTANGPGDDAGSGGSDGGSGSDSTSGSGSGSGTGSGSGGGSGSSSGSASSSGSGGGSGSGSGSGGSSSGSGSGSGTGSSSGSSSGSGSGSGGPDDGGSADAPADANCGTTPTLHQDPAGTIFCGYDADGGKLDCLQSSGDGVCCLGGALGAGQYAPEMCAAAPSGCTNGGDGGVGQSAAIPISCYQVADCANAGVTGPVACCLQTATLDNPVPGCTYAKAVKGSAVVCEGTPATDAGADAAATVTGTCAAGEIQICSSQADCPMGTTCTPGKWKIFQVGFCL